MYDVIIAGGGGAGLTAALYTSRAMLKTLLFEKLIPGGQIATTDMVENYPGFPEGIMGAEISSRMEAQARKYGTEIQYAPVETIEKTGSEIMIKSGANRLTTKSLIIAVGASFKMLGIPGEKELTGKGVSYCATCDGAFFKNKEIVVVGGGDSALQEGIFLTRFVKKLTILHRRDKLRGSPILQSRAKKNPKIEFLWDTILTKIEGTGKVERIQIKNVKTSQERFFDTNGVFIFVGHEPNTKFIQGLVQMDEKGYIITRENLGTSVPGIFACGEVRAGSTRQLVSACGEGCEAALAAQAYLENLE
ncbi:MAG: thioredoxin-disulfide reductase [Omnitrophica bacterium RIFCSPLOWO2_12_FULL_44_17]|uniref:Thioredoxin reductase n=1 Tax=Candidatus Danuiimicrobium aquiferis TaxID=1801832 RepID=A0A1G1KWQ1_9BACT|nr:MAG: thioredoxin-disulfide reductase [Omnitrophica bacterium RIFCSPHIGHO2_02_FULL_45_28]OGW90289.1 MAG: thioredoxin-disulfide reductase [Omnitrophica bacterium RIFCSPHIGHO2_12_FULL_44_12]OGW97222.1 MAG: thioredoxin-disulfide reductase [Omnitrophica bacterium RIFCSPLOWO2_12_FULL_44_17]OGX02278.1 MAG: thioredoxin-disulfide reductase [Omnitrophica bacterium RIFCSPLOWO2_02_FULL_44_11]